MSLLQVSKISKQGEADFVLNDVSFTQKEFQKIVIAGETGSGKSTLLKIIAGLVQPDSGEIVFDNKKVIGPDEKLVPGHPGISYLSQHFELPKSLRVEQVLTYSNLLSDEESDTLYEVCRISHLLKRRTDQLSGGEKQRIALARLLISSPNLLLLDEPFSNLDRIHKGILKSIIRDIGERLKITCILISHEPEDTLSWADEIIVMKEGKILQTGNPEKIYKQPLNEYIAGLFGKYNLISLKPYALMGLSIEAKGKSVFLRPENFKTENTGNNILTGKVKQINFFGSYYELEVGLSDTTILVRTNTCAFTPGNEITVSFSSDDLWYL